MSYHLGQGEDQGGPLPGRQPTGNSIKERAQALLAAGAAAALGLAVLLVTTTLHSLYPGTGSGWFGPPERAAIAEVKTCQRLGPVSIDGLGYWWQCQVTVRVADGRVVTAVVDHSIVTPADRGRVIEFREACWGDGFTRCRYGRPAARGWKVVLGALKLAEGCTLGFVLMVIVVLLISAVGGHRGRLAVSSWAQRGTRTTPRH